MRFKFPRAYIYNHGRCNIGEHRQYDLERFSFDCLLCIYIVLNVQNSLVLPQQRKTKTAMLETEKAKFWIDWRDCILHHQHIYTDHRLITLSSAYSISRYANSRNIDLDGKIRSRNIHRYHGFVVSLSIISKLLLFFEIIFV